MAGKSERLTETLAPGSRRPHPVYSKKAIAWALYDFANSSYSLLIMSFVFPIFFKEVIVGGAAGDFWWGLVVSVSILAGGLFAPIVGAMADHDGRKKVKFAMFASLAMLGTASLYFTGSGTVMLAALVFIATNFCFEIAVTLYDSLLLNVSTRETVGRVSGLGWGLGYLGGVTAMLLLRPLYSGGYADGLLSHYKLTFPLTALFFLLFSLPILFAVKDLPRRRHTDSLVKMIRVGVGKVWATVKEVRKHRNIAIFLLAFYFVNDALVTLFAFVSLYGRQTFGLSVAEIGVLLLIIQLIAFPATALLGAAADRYGSKKALLRIIAIWAVIVVLLAAVKTPFWFYTVAIMSAFVVGSSQAIARSWLAKIIPAGKESEFFGFNGFASKIAATTGPVLFGGISVLTGNQRYAMLALLPYFVISYWLFSKVKE
ncbi:MFS transporter [Candidatus Woesearchaeota archaeon]|nr:MFS transporter [Candidatus Woesearchaeota archaeon]